jgi:GAF domain-containing protein
MKNRTTLQDMVVNMKTKVLAVVVLGLALAGCQRNVLTAQQVQQVQLACSQAGLAVDAERGSNGVTSIRCSSQKGTM